MQAMIASLLVLFIVFAHCASNNPVVSQLRDFAARHRDDKSAQLEQQTPLPSFAAVPNTDWASVQYGECVNLNDKEREILLRDGIVTSERQSFQTFFDAYLELFRSDMPVYITADAIMHSVHRSYDVLLQSFEQASLIQKLTDGLRRVHERLSTAYSGDASLADARLDLDTYLLVARRLLEPTNISVVSVVAGSDKAQVTELISQATAASGAAKLNLFGASRDFDFSPFKPRGHYAGKQRLEEYFRAMMWLGRVEFRLTQIDNTMDAMVERETVAAILLAELAHDVAELADIDRVLSALISYSDNADARQLTDVARQAGIAKASDAPARVAEFRRRLLSSEVGVQRILSQLLAFPASGEDIALPRSFLLLGQRFTLDSNALGSVVAQNESSKPMRLMPQETDVLYAVLRNNAALPYMQTEIERYGGYGGQLAFARAVIDSSPPELWYNSTLYNGWLSALRELSAPSDKAAFDALPTRVRSQAYWRHKMNTQLASYAQLRRNNILYVKESYSGIPGCEFPSVWVEPIPSFFRSLQRYAQLARKNIVPLAPTRPDGSSQTALKVGQYFDKLEEVAKRLESLAAKHVARQPLAKADIDWVNNMVLQRTEDVVCAKITVNSGWFYDLYLNKDALIPDKIVSSIHTQPADEEGNIIGNVLHFGTDAVEATLIVTDDCSDKPVLHVGITQAFKTLKTKDFLRLNDEEWASKYANTSTRPSFLAAGVASASSLSSTPLWTKKCMSSAASPSSSSSSSSLATAAATSLLTAVATSLSTKAVTDSGSAAAATSLFLSWGALFLTATLYN